MFRLAKLTLTVKISGVFSLKEKRSIINRIKTFIISANNTCVAESHHQDSLDYIGLTIGILASKNDYLQSIASKYIEEIEVISEGFVEKKQMESI
ncbi:MAG TPA: DUF503 family protein [Thermotogota bacterium]|nr:DUF503 family protein [Thermotogota bacterium]